MSFILFLLFSSLYWTVASNVIGTVSYVRTAPKRVFGLLYILIWSLFIGSQYNVGTDYESYMYIFNGNMLDFFDNQGEWVFTGAIKILNSMNLYGQIIFGIWAFITCGILIFLLFRVLNSNMLSIFFVVIITVPGLFNNQMNGIRQYIAVYVLTLSILYLLKSKWIYCALFVFIAFHIHASAIFTIPIIGAMYFLRNTKSEKYLYICLIASVLICLLFNAVSALEKYLEYLPIFNKTHLLHAEFEKKDISNLIRKLIYVPMFAYFISLINKIKVTEIQRQFYILGILGFCTKIAFLNISLVSRMGQYFEILMCFPFALALMYARKHNSFVYMLILAFIVIFYFIKVVFFAVGEYAYDSVFFH